MGPTELHAARGQALELLQGWMDRERTVTPTSDPAYLKDILLLKMMARHGYPMERHELNGTVLTYLKDEGMVEYKPTQPDGPRGETYLSWRITHHGLQVLEGTRTDPGVEVC
jgi:hypothetical protein